MTDSNQHIELVRSALLKQRPRGMEPTRAEDAFEGLVEQFETLRSEVQRAADILDPQEVARYPNTAADNARLVLHAVLNPASVPEGDPDAEHSAQSGQTAQVAPSGTLECQACGASIGWEGEFPDDCLRCGVSFPAKRSDDA